jgi:group II intron reverse transcriptase/maturase
VVTVEMYAKVYNMSNMRKAFHAVKKNRGAAGVDNVTISDYKRELDSNLEALQQKLVNQTYISKPVRRTYIDKQDGGKRPLGIPTVEDRLVQQALRQVIEPIFEDKFFDCSYGFRPNRNCHQAIEEVSKNLKRKYRYVIDADLKSYFDTIDHEILLNEIGIEIGDNKILSLIAKTLNSGILEHGCYHETVRGATQGGVTSPLVWKYLPASYG